MNSRKSACREPGRARQGAWGALGSLGVLGCFFHELKHGEHRISLKHIDTTDSTPGHIFLRFWAGKDALVRVVLGFTKLLPKRFGLSLSGSQLPTHSVRMLSALSSMHSLHWP